MRQQIIILQGKVYKSISVINVPQIRCLFCNVDIVISVITSPLIDINSTQRILNRPFNAAINGILDKPLPLNERPDMGLKPPTITIAKDAKGTWIAFADHIKVLQREGGDLFPIKGFASKAAEHAARIAGVLAIFETPDTTEISVDALNGGIAIAQYYIGEALRLFHSASDDQELVTAQKVFDWGMQQEGQMIALAELYRCGPNAVRDKKTATRMNGYS